jgi:hypothetical protein
MPFSVTSSGTPPPVFGPDDAVGPDPHPGVGLHAEEVVSPGRVEEHVLQEVPHPGGPLLAAGERGELGHRQREPDRHARRRGPDGVDRLAVGVDEHVVDPPAEGGVDLAGREGAEPPAGDGDDVGLVDRAGAADDVAQLTGQPPAEGGEQVGRGRVLPSAPGGHPPRRREVVERQHRRDAAGPQGEALPAVVVDGRGRPLARLGLDAAPLGREAVRAQPEVGDEGEVLVRAVPRVAGVARRLGAGGALGVLPGPPVVVPVAALDLVGRGRGAPLEPVGERAAVRRGVGHGPGQ